MNFGGRRCINQSDEKIEFCCLFIYYFSLVRQQILSFRRRVVAWRYLALTVTTQYTDIVFILLTVSLSLNSTELRYEFMDSVDLDTAPKGEGIDCLVPITPDAVAENGDIQSPLTLTLTVVRQQLKLASIDSDSSSPRTPKDGVFDPFAPLGLDNITKAPQSNKCAGDEYRTTVARQLNFHPSFDAEKESLSDQDIVESLYHNLLQLILSKQAEDILAQVSSDSDDCTTPPSPICFTRTCPAAPMKPPGKPRDIQLSLCKKLQF
ncbi:hypothetical protein RJT34_19347 [Clitoria ternatea]|uniref:Uncharacterized protein n=1 Tax=Clitoria ternatea TaxID=43366 RepID=A0AAN9P3A9_CLITE